MGVPDAIILLSGYQQQNALQAGASPL